MPSIHLRLVKTTFHLPSCALHIKLLFENGLPPVRFVAAAPSASAPLNECWKPGPLLGDMNFLLFLWVNQFAFSTRYFLCWAYLKRPTDIHQLGVQLIFEIVRGLG